MTTIATPTAPVAPSVVAYDPALVQHDTHDRRFSPRSSRAWMSDTDVALLDAILQHRAAHTAAPLRVLEWGSGRSTVGFTRYLHAVGIRYDWHSIEHNRAFFAEWRRTFTPLAACTTSVIYHQRDGTRFSERLTPLAAAPASSLTLHAFDLGAVKQLLPPALWRRALARTHHTLALPWVYPPVVYQRDYRRRDVHLNMEPYITLPAALGGGFDVLLVDGRYRRRCLLHAATQMAPGGVTVLHDAWRTFYQCAFAVFPYQQRIGEELWIGSQSPMPWLVAAPTAAVSVAE